MSLQASVPPWSHLHPFSGTLPEGGIITGGHLHHPGGLHDEEGVVHPRGWGFVPVAMCLISLSHVIEMAWAWCIVSFVDIDESYGVFPSLSSCDELSFPFEVFLSDWVFKGFENTWCMSCDGISVVTMGCSIDPLDVCFGDQLAGSVTLGIYA